MTVTISTNSMLSQPLGLVRAMLGDSATWRALVAQPNVTWETLAALITAETSPQNAALSKVKHGHLEDDADHDDYVAPPRIGLRLPDSGDIERLSTMGFSSNLTIIVTAEFPVPDAYQASYQDLYVDGMNKLGGIMRDLGRLPKQAGYADIRRFGLGPVGQVDPDQNNGESWFGGEVLIELRGGLN